jgi:cation:H+ antiporter
VIVAVVLLAIGLALLTLGADRFVVAAARLAGAWGLSSVLIGALVVGLGTSAPELLVSSLAAARGEVDLALGNVVGSNTANVTLVLGMAALFTPIASRLRTVRREGLAMFVAVTVMAILLWNLRLDRVEALGLTVGLVVALGLLVWWSRRDDAEGRGPDLSAPQWHGPVGREIVVGLFTLGMTLAGADLLVRGAVRLAEEVGLSSAFVGLVIVSIGTSLPELATSIAGARRGETDLVLGNVLGSNLFNTLGVAGIAGLIHPGSVDPGFRIALGFMVVSGLAAGLFAVSGRKIVRWEGAVLLAAFAGFVVATV